MVFRARTTYYWKVTASNGNGSVESEGVALPPLFFDEVPPTVGGGGVVETSLLPNILQCLNGKSNR